MKARAICHESMIQKHFFLLMIVPLFIGLLISLTSLAHAEWKTKDDPLVNPKNQGWTQIQTQRVPSKTQKDDGKV
jgi:hypothetical protein